MVHNLYFNTTSKVKLSYFATLGTPVWWDNGTLPIWITAQRQVKLPPEPKDGSWGTGKGGTWPRKAMTL